MTTPGFDKCILCYSEFQDAYKGLQFQSRSGEMKPVVLNKGIDEKVVDYENLGTETCLIVDDLIDEISPPFASKLFTKLSHHRHIR